MNINKEKLLKNLTQTISSFTDELEHIPTCKLENFNPKDSLVVMIDMINGFCKFGALSSPNVEKLIPKMGLFLDECIEKDIPILAYQDSHEKQDCEEFNYYPPHCQKGSDESEIVDELKRENMTVVPKNSTNGFLAKNPLELFPHVKNFLVIGCVTDICVRDFSATMSKYLQEKNIHGKVYVIENLVDTYQIDSLHEREVEHILALYHLKSEGVGFLRY